MDEIVIRCPKAEYAYLFPESTEHWTCDLADGRYPYTVFLSRSELDKQLLALGIEVS